MLALALVAASTLCTSFPFDQASTEMERMVCEETGFAELDRALARVPAETDPPTALARRGSRTVAMFGGLDASRARYAGLNECFWRHQGEAKVTWRYRAAELRCRADK